MDTNVRKSRWEWALYLPVQHLLLELIHQLWWNFDFLLNPCFEFSRHLGISCYGDLFTLHSSKASIVLKFELDDFLLYTSTQFYHVMLPMNHNSRISCCFLTFSDVSKYSDDIECLLHEGARQSLTSVTSHRAHSELI